MTEIYVDADGCAVKEEVVRVASRHGLKTWMVSDGGVRPSHDPNVRVVVVPSGPDAADNWIAERIGRNDVCVTNDTPLASRCLAQGAKVLKANGQPFTEDSIGMALANRDLMAGLRESGMVTGGPPPFSKQDRSRFLNALETMLQAIARSTS